MVGAAVADRPNRFGKNVLDVGWGVGLFDITIQRGALWPSGHFMSTSWRGGESTTPFGGQSRRCGANPRRGLVLRPTKAPWINLQGCTLLQPLS